MRMPKRRASSGGIVSGIAEAIGLLVTIIVGAIRFTIRHPVGVGLGVVGYVVFISFALGNKSFTAGLIALLVLSSGNRDLAPLPAPASLTR